MKPSNIVTLMACKYPSILTGLIFISTSVLPFATIANAQSAPVLTIDKNITLTGVLPVGSPAIYQVTIKNTSTVPARNVKITDTLPAGFKYDKELTILTKGAVVPSTGTAYLKPSSTNNTNILEWNNYDIPAGGIVTLFFTANTSSATVGTFSNSVTVNYKDSSGVAQTAVTNSGSGADDNVVIKAVPQLSALATAVQTDTAKEFTPEIYCGGTPGTDGIATNITGIINTYFQPSLQSVTAGSKEIAIMSGAAKGTNKDIKSGDLLLIVQMQDASINTANTDTYGSGSTTSQGSGQSNMGNTGLYEYAIAASDVSFASGGSTLKLKKPLINPYTSSAAIPASTGIPGSGQKRFQVVRVPQYASIKVQGTLFASPWDGNVGGILAVDTFGQFDFNSQRISANSVGFRGGFGLQNGGLAAVDTHVSPTSIYPIDASGRVSLKSTGAPTAITTARTSGSGKGEGTAGTPRFISTQSLTSVDPIDGRPVWNGGSLDNIVEGYPGGDTGRGAPANAGGGGNYHNSGGGGGGNGGIGGQGGLAWSNGSSYVPKDSGGRPGFLSSTKTIVPWQLMMGGGGGGGEANDSPQGVPGGAGGGIVILRAGTIKGPGSIYANGRDGDRGAYGGNPDGAGGAGAGGTVLIQSRNAVSGIDKTITIEAKGGNGGSTERDAFFNYRTTPVTDTTAQSTSNEGVGFTADGYPYSHTPHGPGGGGGGGIVLYNTPGANIQAFVDGGASGHTDDPAKDKPGVSGRTMTPHGATPGSDGIKLGFSNSEDPFNSLNNATNCSPKLSVANESVTKTVVQGKVATYKIEITNTAPNGSATLVDIKDTLPTGFVYTPKSNINDEVVLKGGSTRTTVANPNPTVNSTEPVWSGFTIPPGGGVEINFNAVVNTPVIEGKVYDNKVTTSYPDPAREPGTPAKVIEALGTTSTVDDVKGGKPVAPTAKPDGRVWNFNQKIRISHR
jgi:uncharacterized repeat protein (TIGR01451 family)/fimbrial isopeptide formation D2 family protein